MVRTDVRAYAGRARLLARVIDAARRLRSLLLVTRDRRHRSLLNAEAPTKRRYYSEDSISRALKVFEERFGMASEEFYERYRQGEELPYELPRGMANSWAGLYEEYESVRGDEADLAAQVEREIEVAVG